MITKFISYFPLIFASMFLLILLIPACNEQPLVVQIQQENPKPKQPIFNPTPIPYVPTELDNKILEIVKTNCKACHSHRSTKRLHLYTEDEKLAQLNYWETVDLFYQVYKKEMPKNRDPLTKEELNTIVEWMREKFEPPTIPKENDGEKK